MLRGVTVSGIAISPSSINGVTTDATTNKPVTAALLAGGTLTGNFDGYVTVSKSDYSSSIFLENTDSTTGNYPSFSISNYRGSGAGFDGFPLMKQIVYGGNKASPSIVPASKGIGSISFHAYDGTNLQSLASLTVSTASTFGAGNNNGMLSINIGFGGGFYQYVFESKLTVPDFQSNTGILSSGPTTGIGYSTGAGGTVTQQTNRSTAVTIAKVSGTIVTDTTSLAAGAVASFTVNNTTVAATDGVIVTQASGSNSGDTDVSIIAVAANSFTIKVANRAAATAETGAIVINFQVIKGVAA